MPREGWGRAPETHCRRGLQSTHCCWLNKLGGKRVGKTQGETLSGEDLGVERE